MALPPKPILTNPPTPLPTQGDSPVAFSERMNQVVQWLPQLTDNLQDAVDWAEAAYGETVIEADRASDAAGDADSSGQYAAEAADRAESAAERSVSAAQKASEIVNYRGQWADATGPAEFGGSYSYNGLLWLLQSSVPDISESVPSEENPDWISLREPDVGVDEVGEVVYSFNKLDELPGNIFVRTGQVYLQDEYQILYNVIGEQSSAPGQRLTNPTMTPITIALSISFGTAGRFAVASNLSPYLVIMVVSDGIIMPLPNPAALPTGTGRGVAFSPNGNYLAVAHDASPYLSAYHILGSVPVLMSVVGGNFPTGNGRGVAFSPDGNYLAVAHDTSPYLTVYSISGNNLTKIANPAALPTGNGRGVAFSPDGNYLAVAHIGSPYLTIYSVNAGVFTKLPNPAVLPAGDGNGVAFSPDGNHLAVTHTGSPHLTVYSISDGVFTKIPNPSSLPTGATGVAFSPDGASLAVTRSVTPFVSLYRRSGDELILLPNPSQLPTGATGVAFSPDSSLMGFSRTDAVMSVYRRTYPFDPEYEFYIPYIPPADENVPGWSPDNRADAFVRAK